MTEPVDAVLAVHNAFRNDMVRIDTAALESAKGKQGLEATIERWRSAGRAIIQCILTGILFPPHRSPLEESTALEHST